ncbi:MAG: hypothetical protein ACE5IM_08060 [Nitrospinota bacterium]
MLRNGRPVNPLSMKLIAGRPLPRADRVRFFRIRDALLGQFRTVIRLLEARAEVEVVAVRTASP